MKKIFFAALALALSVGSYAQTDDPVLMTVNGKPVTRGEFEYEFNKNNSDGASEGSTVEDYLPMFVNYKLKVQAAYTARYDTLTSYKEEFRKYRDALIQPMLVTDEDIEKQVRDYYDNVLYANIGEKGLCHAGHIFIGLRQNAPAADMEKAKGRIDSIYAALKGGAVFEELAKKHSQDGTAQRGGDLGTFGPGQMVKEFEEVAYGTADSTFSAPFRTNFGWHIVKTYEHKPLDSFEILHDQIKTFLERQRLRERMAANIADSLSRERGMSMEDLMDIECERICAQDAETRFLVKEYREGLLLFEICDREVWTPAKADEAGQEKYFKSHKKDYTWTEPRFMGVVLQAADEQAMKETEALLKKVKDHRLWVDTVKNVINADSVRVRVEYRLFAKGDNRFVDTQVFGVEKKAAKLPKFPVVKCVGEVLKKKPSKWYDVLPQVQQDYQRYQENKWVEELRKVYPVVVNEEVLKTVNKH